MVVILSAEFYRLIYQCFLKENKNLYLGSGMLGVTFAPSEDDFQ